MFIVTTNDGEQHEVDADSMEIDPETSRLVLKRDGELVGAWNQYSGVQEVKEQ